MFGMDVEKKPPMEENGDNQLGVRNERKTEGLTVGKPGDGMETHEEIKGYDPYANPINNPLENKQGVGKQVYDPSASDFDYNEYKEEND